MRKNPGFSFKSVVSWPVDGSLRGEEYRSGADGLPVQALVNDHVFVGTFLGSGCLFTAVSLALGMISFWGFPFLSRRFFWSHSLYPKLLGSHEFSLIG